LLEPVEHKVEPVFEPLGIRGHLLAGPIADGSSPETGENRSGGHGERLRHERHLGEKDRADAGRKFLTICFSGLMIRFFPLRIRDKVRVHGLLFLKAVCLEDGSAPPFGLPMQSPCPGLTCYASRVRWHFRNKIDESVRSSELPEKSWRFATVLPFSSGGMR
jgi:hypothetical protein